MPSKSLRSRPTHFLCLPLNQSSLSGTRLSQFGQNLLSSIPPIPGLDESIVIKPERLHLTLGVMPLSTPKDRKKSNQVPHHFDDMNQVDEVEQSKNAIPAEELPMNTVEDALRLLRTLQKPLLERLGEPLSIDLSRIDVMKPPRGSAGLGEAHVLWAGPESICEGDEGNTKLHEICSKTTNPKHLLPVIVQADFIHNTFKDAKYINEDRPLQLHCTIVNTVYRKRQKRSSSFMTDSIDGRGVRRPGESQSVDVSGAYQGSPRFKKGRGQERIPFSYEAVRSSEALRAIAVEPDIGSKEVNGFSVGRLCELGQVEQRESPRQSGKHLPPVHVELGRYPIMSVELCEMGSYDENGCYRSVGGIPLLPLKPSGL